MIPDRISYPHSHFPPIFYLNLRKKGMENPRKSHPFYKPAVKLVLSSFLKLRVGQIAEKDNQDNLINDHSN